MLLLLLTACASDEISWALNSATLQPDSTGIVGTHVWSFFPERWERKQDEDQRQCFMVQDLTGDVIAELEGCRQCQAMYAVSLSPVESDCPDSITSNPSYTGLVAFGVGEIHPDIAHLDPFPGDSLGWYLSFDGEIAMAQGFVYPQALDQGEEPRVLGWSVDGLYTFSPAYAWDL